MRKIKIDNSQPNRLHGSQITKFPPDDEGTLVGVLALDTDQGELHIAINRAAADDLAQKLKDFLSRQ